MSRKQGRIGLEQGDEQSDRHKADSHLLEWFRVAIGLAIVLIVTTMAITGCTGEPADEQEPAAGQSTTQSASQPDGPLPPNRVDVVYFHRTQRCTSCVWVAQGAKYTVETYFKDELASGKVTFREINVQEKENAELARHYGASGSSLFINTVRQGVDNIEEAGATYPYVGNEQMFTQTLHQLITQSLEEI